MKHVIEQAGDDLERDWLKYWSRTTPHAIALQDAENNRSYSYSVLYHLSYLLAHELERRFSVTQNTRVAVLASNSTEYVVLFFAIQRLGAVMVPLNFRLTARELEHILRDSDCALLITEAAVSDALSGCATDSVPKMRWNFGNQSFFNDTNNLTSFLASMAVTCAELPWQNHDFRAQDDSACMILYTSGTTGAPKGALITPKMLVWNALNTVQSLELTAADVHVSFLPFFHTGGWNVLLTPFLFCGAKTVMIKKFNADQVLEISAREKATVLFGVPTTMDLMAQSAAFQHSNLNTVRYAITGGEPMPIALIQTWSEKGVPIRQGYGLTEFGPNNFSLPQRDALRKIGSIGFPNKYVEAKVVDENLQEVSENSVGELILRGPGCFLGYWRNSQATAETLRDGWLHTGDLVRRDSEGYFYIVGRKKDMFISGAENVYPAEVEQVLRTHPMIREAAVIGVPDPKWGEVGKAFVVLANPQDAISSSAILSYCEANLAKYKIPKLIKFVKELPKGDSGKILKRDLPND